MDNDSALSFLAGSELFDAVTLAERWPISAPPGPIAWAMVCGEGVGLGEGAGSGEVEGNGAGAGEAVDVGAGDAAVLGAGAADGVGAGLTSAAVATPAIQGPAINETANRAVPRDFMTGRRD
ncbi:hypothetical protein [Pseudarthrobacter sp. NPDC058119]|uniref:hypothetical protein n=1 Tax=Pseudarthrobacter sp. NPDC058119 TaxID=3346348 RepID=UPI0036DCBD52